MTLANAEVADYARQLEAVVQESQTLCAPLGDDAFNRQPGPGRWSVGQCLEHLNITERKMLARMEPAAQQIRARGGRAAGPTRHGWIMTWLINDMEPPVKRRYPTGKGFLPAVRLSKTDVLREFVALHQRVQRLLESVDGYDLNAAKVQSPFFRLLRYRLGSAVALMCAHDRRHVWQAKQVVKQLS
jgi:hypothetical protein